MAAEGDSGKQRAGISSLSNNVDLLSEILLRLPSKSLMRFKTVCKSWRAMIISRYFCLLWRQHREGPGILLRSRFLNGKNSYVRLNSGLTTAIELPNDLSCVISESCNGFLLLEDYNIISDPRKRNYWVYNPATLEVVALPPPRMDACEIHPRCCNCCIENPVLVFDSHSNRRVVALAKPQLPSSRKQFRRELYQVCVTQNQGPWRSSSKMMIMSHPLSDTGVHWRNFVVWISLDKTLFYDVGGEGLRFCASPDSSLSEIAFCEGKAFFEYHLGESGGHLHFIHGEKNLLIVNEMKHDLSGWFVKHNIVLSQIRASVFGSSIDINRDIRIPYHRKFTVNLLMEEGDQDSKLVLAFGNKVFFYRIQDQKSWKLCEWEPTYTEFYFDKFVYRHVETISRFHDQY